MSWFKTTVFGHSGIWNTMTFWDFGLPRIAHLSSQAVKGCLAGGERSDPQFQMEECFMRDEPE